MPPELSPKAIYEFEFKETAHALSFFMPYDLEITAPNDVIIDMGRFSLGVLARVHVIPPHVGGASLKIGAFCEAAKGATILVGGDHANSSLLNYSFGLHAEYYQQFMSAQDRAHGLAPAKPILVGDNVVLSRGATVLGAAEIGTGSVIGAGAVVTGSLEPFGIYGGIPAKIIRNRFDDRMAELYTQMDLPNIRAHSLANLPSKVAQLQSGSLSIEQFRSSVEYLTARPKVHVEALIKDGTIAIHTVRGFSVGGDPVTNHEAVEKMHRYFAQPITKPKTIKWSPDIFLALGLYGPD